MRGAGGGWRCQADNWGEEISGGWRELDEESVRGWCVSSHPHTVSMEGRADETEEPIIGGGWREGWWTLKPPPRISYRFILLLFCSLLKETTDFLLLFYLRRDSRNRPAPLRLIPKVSELLCL